MSRARQVVGCRLAGCELTRSLTGDLFELEAADHCFGKKSLTNKDHFWKGSCQSLLVWNKEIIAL
ncbi:UNVERIFIED_CONTAM: hypothetical protein Sradi_3615200 [Sesamum radiatum]|uniref:Uncharacterized protein n=1 Tax=Sesamum radiatum TaxID=300843 RepID=A0AAW2QH68_SESRA